MLDWSLIFGERASFFRFSSFIGYCKILSIVYCAIQEVLAGDLFLSGMPIYHVILRGKKSRLNKFQEIKGIRV